MSDYSDYFKNLAAFEQAGAGLRPVASVLASYMNALVEQGLERGEAIVLVKELQDRIFEVGFSMFKNTK